MKISLLADCPQDVEVIATWYFQQWESKKQNASVTTVVEKVRLGLNRDCIPIAFVAHIDEEPVGAGELKYRELLEYPGYCYWLDGIYVPQKHRGKGLSTRLIEFAKSKAIELKLPALYLRCEDHNVKLYENRGFQVIETEQSKFIMELRFS